MHKAKNMYFLLIEKEISWAKARGCPRQGTFPYMNTNHICKLEWSLNWIWTNFF